MQGILKKAVTGALEAAQKELALAAAAAINNAAARAIKSRCLSCDHEVHPVRPESVGPLPSKAGARTQTFSTPITSSLQLLDRKIPVITLRGTITYRNH